MGVMKYFALIFLLSLLNFCNIGKVGISTNSKTKSVAEDKKIVLKIGDKKISYGEWKDYLKENSLEEDMEDVVLSKLFDEFINQELILKEALDEGYSISSQKYQKFLKEFGLKDSEESKKTFLITFFLEKNVKGKVVITTDELKKYYREHYMDFRQKKLYHIKEIVVNKKELAQEIHTELVKNGVLRFGNFAKEYSISPSAVNGGDLGYFSKNQLPPEFEKIIFSLKPGKISDVIRTKYGYHIFYLEEVLGEHQLKFYEVKDRIESVLRERKEKKRYNALLDVLKKKYKIVINRKKLGFNYMGDFNN